MAKMQFHPSILVLGLLYGIVQFVLNVPALYGYAAVIFLDDTYIPYMAPLSKLVVFSSMIHQISFSMFSSLPFAIGQVQDAGLIFLSHMASKVAQDLAAQGEGPKTIVATTTVVLGLATAALGVALVVIGRLKLGRYVSLLPMPVIGGYLAFIGYFCLEAGVTICANTAITTPSDWLQILTTKNLSLVAPALVCGGVFSYVSRKVESIVALPAAMLAAPALFYVALALSGGSLADARAYGFVGEASGGVTYAEAFKLYDFALVRWDVVPGLALTWVGMLVVCAFGSSLDVAAIEMDLGRPLRINHELTTVGFGNIASGLLGGFTGSYIFSSTVFNYRTRLHTHVIGWTLALTELGLVCWTGDPLGYVPLFFFGSTLVFVAIELMLEWLVEVRAKLPPGEYLVLLVTFLAINITSLEQGMLIGVAAAVLRFIVLYAQEHQVEFRHMKSRVVRPPRERQLLDERHQAIVTVQLTGEVFFGSAGQLLEEIKDLLRIDEVPTPDFTATLPGRGGDNDLGALEAGADGPSPAALGSPALAAGQRVSRSLALGVPGSGFSPTSSPGLAVRGPLTEARRAELRAAARGEAPPGGGRGGGADWRSERSSPQVHLGGSLSTSPGNPMGVLHHSPGVGGFTALTQRDEAKRSNPTLPSLHLVRRSSRDSSNPTPATEKSNLVNITEDQSLQYTSGFTEIESPGLLRARSDGAITPSSRGGVVNEVGRKPSFLDTLRATLLGVPPPEPHEPPKFIVMDCSRLTAIDASAARNCFMPLKKMAEMFAFKLVYAACKPKVAFLLKAHDALGGTQIKMFGTVYAALDYCEVALLRDLQVQSSWAHPHHHGSSSRSRVRTFSFSAGDEATGSGPHTPGGTNFPPRTTGPAGEGAAAGLVWGPVTTALRTLLELDPADYGDLPVLAAHCEEQEFVEGAAVFAKGDPSRHFYVIVRGEVNMEHEVRPTLREKRQRQLSSSKDLGALAREASARELRQSRHRGGEGRRGGDPHLSAEEMCEPGELLPEDLPASAGEAQADADAAGLGLMGGSSEGLGGRVSRRRLEVTLRRPAVFGYVDFQLQQRRQFRATAAGAGGAALAVFGEEALAALLAGHPQALCRLQKALLRASATELHNLPAT